MRLLIITQKANQNDQLLGFFVEWLRRFAQKFDKLIVLCLEKGKYDLPSNVEVISLGKDRGASKLKLLSNFYFLITTLHKQYDAVFVHMNPIWIVVGGFCWTLMGKRRFLWYTTRGVTLKLKIAEKFVDKIFTASPESFRIKSKKVVVTGHGIDTSVFAPVNHKSQITNHKLKILGVGRISPVKNYEILIDAAKILADKDVNFSVTLVGEPALNSDIRYLARLKFKVQSFKLEDKFNFVGKINHRDLPKYYQSHDMFVHLSKTGSLDKTLLEAMACGMKILSSNDSARSFLSEEMVFDENSPTGLVEKILNISGKEVDPKLRNYIVENHDLDKLINKISAIIQS